MTNEDELVKKYERLIYLALKNKHIYWKTNDEFQDYIDSGYDGLIKGIRTFDETKGIKESSYVYICIETEIKRRLYLNQMIKRKTKVSSLNYFVNEEDELLDLIPSEFNLEQIVEDNIRNEKLIEMIDHLPNMKDRLCIKMLYGLDGWHEISASELARRWGVNKNAIISRRNKVLRMLWYRIRKYGL